MEILFTLLRHVKRKGEGLPGRDIRMVTGSSVIYLTLIL